MPELAEITTLDTNGNPYIQMGSLVSEHMNGVLRTLTDYIGGVGKEKLNVNKAMEVIEAAGQEEEEEEEEDTGPTPTDGEGGAPELNPLGIDDDEPENDNDPAVPKLDVDGDGDDGGKDNDADDDGAPPLAALQQ